MFAFAVLDRTDESGCAWRAIASASSRCIGPVRANTVLVFGSELKALTAHPDCPAEIDRGARQPASCASAMCQRLSASIAAAPQAAARAPCCMWRQTGNRNCPSTGDARSVAGVRGCRAWRHGRTGRAGAAGNPAGRRGQAADDLRRTLGRFPVRRHRGSSLVTALAPRRRAIGPCRTFSIGFAEAGIRRGALRRTIAKHLGTEHTEL